MVSNLRIKYKTRKLISKWRFRCADVLKDEFQKQKKTKPKSNHDETVVNLLDFLHDISSPQNHETLEQKKIDLYLDTIDHNMNKIYKPSKQINKSPQTITNIHNNIKAINSIFDCEKLLTNLNTHPNDKSNTSKSSVSAKQDIELTSHTTNFKPTTEQKDVINKMKNFTTW